MQYARIPLDRIGVLIGENGSTKREIEKRTNTKLTIDDTSVSIEGDPIDEWSTLDILRAIGRGFSPEIALRLTNPEYDFELVEIDDIIGDSKKAITRIKGRVIGTKGKSKRVIEDITNTMISIYGKTVGIIGLRDDVSIAKEAIIMIISGSPHSTVYKFLEKSRVQGNFKPHE